MMSNYVLPVSNLPKYLLDRLTATRLTPNNQVNKENGAISQDSAWVGWLRRGYSLFLI